MTYRHFKEGLLAEPGTWLDQPALMMNAMNVVGKAVDDAQEIQRKTQEKKRAAIQAAPKPSPVPKSRGTAMGNRPTRR